MGHPPTDCRFQDVGEVYIFRVSGGKLAGAFGVGDNMTRRRRDARPRRSGLAGRVDCAGRPGLREGAVRRPGRQRRL